MDIYKDRYNPLSLEELVRGIVKKYNLKPTIDDKRPESYGLFVEDQQPIDLQYSRFQLPLQFAQTEEEKRIATLVEGGDEEQRKRYLEHGPYRESLDVKLPSQNNEPFSKVNIKAYNVVDEHGQRSDQFVSLYIPAQDAERHITHLRCMNSVLAKEFADMWDAEKFKHDNEAWHICHITIYKFYPLLMLIEETVKQYTPQNLPKQILS